MESVFAMFALVSCRLENKAVFQSDQVAPRL
uniref:Uncharacterized protein n=1 Tax=Anguilla anguilla TaxID=7936 RepID=A0A0E9RNI6_ANGAN